jgi:hypothetical protein
MCNKGAALLILLALDRHGSWFVELVTISGREEVEELGDVL